MNLIKFFKKNYALQNIKKSKGILAIMLIAIPVITLFCLHSVDSSGYGDPYAGFSLPQHEKNRANNGLRRFFRLLQRGKIPLSPTLNPTWD